MQIITPHFIYFKDRISTNLSIAYDSTIHKIAPIDVLTQEFPHAKITTLSENSLLMPGLINAHVHIEFSANTTQLSYGDFITWLYSVIENRDELIGGCDTACMSQAIESMLDSGITTFGAISTHGLDLDACADAKQNVIYFNELIGSQATMADTLYGDFLSRLEASKSVSRQGFKSGVAIHSPYSVHPILIQKALNIVKSEKLPLTAHFMESQAEREWLDTSSGEFQDFFETLLKQSKNVSNAQEFLTHFNSTPTLLAHAVNANSEELDSMAIHGHTVIHCPISNRLLGNATLDIEALNKRKIRWIVATDGLSSNYKLDLFEEMKIALFMQDKSKLLEFAHALLDGVTIHAAAALGINSGEIAEGKNADMIVLDLDAPPTKDLAIHLILHQYNISKVYINGTLAKGE